MDECERNITHRSSRISVQSSATRSPSRARSQAAVPEHGAWEDVETRPCGSRIAAGFQVARAFQDVSKELNQGTLL